MKKILHLSLGVVAIASVLSFQSCDRLSGAVADKHVDITGASGDITIPPSNDTTSQALMGQTDVPIDLDNLISQQSGGALGFDNIDNVKLKSITLTLTNGDINNNFSNFTICAATFNTDANGGSLSPYTICDVEDNPDVYTTTLSPSITDGKTDLKPYFNKKMTVYYLIAGKLRRKTTATLTCHVDVTYDIALKLPKP